MSTDNTTYSQFRTVLSWTEKVDGTNMANAYSCNYCHCFTERKHCAGCGVTVYCSVECQRADWKTGEREKRHKTRCRKIKIMRCIAMGDTGDEEVREEKLYDSAFNEMLQDPMDPATRETRKTMFMIIREHWIECRDRENCAQCSKYTTVMRNARSLLDWIHEKLPVVFGVREVTNDDGVKATRVCIEVTDLIRLVVMVLGSARLFMRADMKRTEKEKKELAVTVPIHYALLEEYITIVRDAVDKVYGSHADEIWEQCGEVADVDAELAIMDTGKSVNERLRKKLIEKTNAKRKAKVDAVFDLACQYA